MKKFFSGIYHKITQLPPVLWVIKKSKVWVLPGFKGIPLFDVVYFFWKNASQLGFTERASAIAFNFTMAIPPVIIALFALIPYIPISNDIIMQLFSFIRDVVPGEENNTGIINFLEDILNKPRTRLLSTGFILATFFSSNAMMGIMRSFDKAYPGFKKRTGVRTRLVAFFLTAVTGIIFILTLVALILQGSVLKWLGIENEVLLQLINSAKWLLLVFMYFTCIAFIYKYGPAVNKKWPFFNPGALVATLLMVILVVLFSFWVSNFSNYNELYGSIGTILIVMLLLYLNSLILLIGFELNISIYSLHHQKQGL